MKQDFTTFGAKRFRQDILAIDKMVRGMGNASLMHKLLEATELLSLPVKNEEEDEKGLNLREVMNMVHGRVADADEVLSQRLGFVVLSRHEARLVLARRREAAE